MPRRPVSQLPLAETRSQAELQLSLLHNILLRFADGPAERLYRPPSLGPNFSLFPTITTADRLPQLSREEARVGLIRVADRLGEAKCELTRKWEAFHAEFAGVDEADAKRRGNYLALGRVERHLVDEEYGAVARVLDRRRFNGIYCRMGSWLLEQLERTPHIAQGELELMRDTLGLSPRAEGVERIQADDKVTNLLKKLVEVLIIFRRATDTARLGATTPLSETPSHGELQLIALSEAVQDFAGTTPRQLYVRGEMVTEIEARDALLLISSEVSDSAAELRREWEAFYLQWDLFSSQDTRRLEAHDGVCEEASFRVKNAFEFVAKSLDRRAFCDEFLRAANALLDRFDAEPALDSEAQEKFRTMVGLRKYKRLGVEDKIQTDDKSTIDLLKIFLELQAIEAALPPRPTAVAIRKVLREVKSSSGLIRPIVIKPRSKSAARELGAGGVWRAEGRGGVVMSARKARMYAI